VYYHDNCIQNHICTTVHLQQIPMRLSLYRPHHLPHHLLIFFFLSPCFPSQPPGPSSHFGWSSMVNILSPSCGISGTSFSRSGGCNGLPLPTHLFLALIPNNLWVFLERWVSRQGAVSIPQWGGQPWLRQLPGGTDPNWWDSPIVGHQLHFISPVMYLSNSLVV